MVTGEHQEEILKNNTTGEYKSNSSQLKLCSPVMVNFISELASTQHMRWLKTTTNRAANA